MKFYKYRIDYRRDSRLDYTHLRKSKLSKRNYDISMIYIFMIYIWYIS